MCSRKADGAILNPGSSQPVQDGLLAAHHVRVGVVALRNAGKDPDIAGLPGNPDGAIGKRGKIGGDVKIGRFLPTLGGAGHAADQDRRVLWHPHRRQIALQFRTVIVARQAAHAAV